MPSIATQIKITLLSVKCTMSDDEGSNNDADMDRFKIVLQPRKGLKPSEPKDSSTSEPKDSSTSEPKDSSTDMDKVILWEWSTSEDKTVVVGFDFVTAFNLNNVSKTITFVSNSKFDVNFATLDIIVSAREYDSTSDDEYGENISSLKGLKNEKNGMGMLDNNGSRTITVSSSDFTFDVNLKIEEVED